MEREELVEKLETQVKELCATFKRICELQDVQAEHKSLSVAVFPDGYYSYWNAYWELPHDLGINRFHLADG